jgi:hypothetical protein
MPTTALHLRAGAALGLFVLLLALGRAAQAAEPAPPAASHAGAAVAAWLSASQARAAAARAYPGAAEANRSVAALVDMALGALRGEVPRQSHPDALRQAFHAYYLFRTAYPDAVRKPYLYFVDFGLGSRTPRGYVFDMAALRLVEGPFTVSHGRGSAPAAEEVPTRFSNTPASYMTSLGLFMTQETYAFNGRSGGRFYRSIGLRLNGISGAFNNAARLRGVVAHGAPYVTPTEAGRSEGCPAMEEDRAQRLLPRISNGSLVFLFSPHDPRWMRDDPWVGPGPVRTASAGP